MVERPNRVYLDVPDQQKTQAKAAGANSGDYLLDAATQPVAARSDG